MPRRATPRWAVAVAAVAVALAVLTAAVAFGPRLWAFFSDGKAVQAWVDAQGPLAPLAMAGLVTRGSTRRGRSRPSQWQDS